MTDYLQLARDVVAQASAKGVEAEAFIMDEQETEVQLGLGEVEKLSQSGSKGIGVRVIDGGRVGYAYTSDFSPESMRKTWQTAIELAAVASPDEFRGLPDPQPVPDEDLEIYDPALASVTPEQKIALAGRVGPVALAVDPRVAMVPETIYADAISHVYLANSKGFAGSYDRTVVWCYATAVAREGERSVEAEGLDASIFFGEVDPEKIGREAGERAIAMLGGTPVPTQTCAVVFDPIVTAQLLRAIAEAMTAEAMQKRRSFLLDRLGQDIATDRVSLLDNGRMKRGFASAPFDAEGVPTSATRLIDEGVFQNVIYDTYTARKDGKASTGNAQRGSHRRLPGLGISNFYMQPGTKTPAEIIAGTQNGMYVTRIMQTGGIDPITGECSMGAYGRWIENGKLTHPVSGVTVATTLRELLMNISEVGNDLRLVPFGGAISAPTIRVDHVTVGGLE